MTIRFISLEEIQKVFITSDFEINTDLIKKFKYFNYDYSAESNHIGAFKNNILVGILAFKIKNDITYLNYVTVDPEYQNLKIATKLLTFFIDNLSTTTLLSSYYSEEGTKLIGTITSLAKKKPEVNIYHRIKDEYQNARFPIINIGDSVLFKENRDEWSRGIVAGFYLNQDYKFIIEIFDNTKIKTICPLDLKKE